MSKVRYKFNTKSLTYEKVKVSVKEKIWYVLSYLATGLVFATITIFLSNKFLPSPSEKKRDRELEAITLKYELLNKKMEMVEKVLADMEDRDDNIYRTIFEAEPLPKSIRNAGFGGSDKYSEFDMYENGELMKNTAMRLDKIAKRMYIQSKSFDEVVKLAKSKEQLIQSIPAI
ncbi:MAG: M23 family peptidase, partial [Bacteroidia bacterium]|nr:M23 family peptidase [Bacteroidia bacterium]